MLKKLISIKINQMTVIFFVLDCEKIAALTRATNLI